MRVILLLVVFVSSATCVPRGGAKIVVVISEMPGSPITRYTVNRNSVELARSEDYAVTFLPIKKINITRQEYDNIRNCVLAGESYVYKQIDDTRTMDGTLIRFVITEGKDSRTFVTHGNLSNKLQNVIYSIHNTLKLKDYSDQWRGFPEYEVKFKECK